MPDAMLLRQPEEEITNMALERKTAYWTCDTSQGDALYYFAPTDRTPPPCTTQRQVRAIIDVAADGTLAGIELIDDMPPPPAPRQP